MIVDVVLTIGLWLGWPEELQRKTNGCGHIWLLLDIAGLPRIEQNCTALATGYFVIGIVVATLGAGAAYVAEFWDYIFTCLL